MDADGRPLNAYPLVHPVAGAQPGTPWAVHLADTQGRFRLLCADLDAKPSADAAAADAVRLAGVLADLGIPHLMCASGPTGGRHVWLGLRESVDAEVVSALAYLLKAWLPTLDVAPLVNPASGCVRPPGSPHRLGGVSQVIAGSVHALTEATVTLVEVHALMSRIAEQVHHALPSEAPPQHRPVAEENGMPFLPGAKRQLSVRCRAQLDAPPTGDLSAVLWRVLCGAAAARWRFADIMAIADAPGLEHARTLRAGATRIPRPARGPASPMAVLRRQWTRAVQTVSNLAPGQPQEHTDGSFNLRAEVVAAIVRTVQRRADATPGRWGRSRSGLAQRRILDALCLFHLQGVRADEVEADIRRLALTCGLDRETARRSLLALAADGWIGRTRDATGRRGARWTIDPGGVVHTRVSGVLSQADPRPSGTGPSLRIVLSNELADRLHGSAHDAFATTEGLGLEAGSLYGRLADRLDTMQCSQLLGWSMVKTTRVLDRLGSAGLIEWRGYCWTRAIGELDRVAAHLGTEGVGRRRAVLYSLAADAVTAGRPSLTLTQQDQLAQAIFNALFRMGRLQPLVEDEQVENIIITGYDRVWLELADGSRIQGPPVADSDQELIDFLAFLASRSEVNARPFSEAQPRLHLRLDDGSRLAATAWVTPRPSVVIRRHRLTEVTLDDLVTRGSLSPLAASFLTAAIRARLSVVVSGPQGFGKTTMARALCGAFDPAESVATLESEYELALHEMPGQHAIVHAWESRPGSGERGPDGRTAGEFTLTDALFDSFRFTVGRTIVGEIRGPEAWLMIKAMESGSGSISTTHSVDAAGAMRKLITCAMEFGPQITHELATLKLAESIDLIVQLDMDSETLPDGVVRRRRWVSEIIAITPGEKEKGYATTTVFHAGDTRRATAHTLPDNLRRLERHGFDLAGFLTEARTHGGIS